MAAEDYDDDAEDGENQQEADALVRQQETDRGRRQLARGRLAVLSDRIAGGAARPGQQDIVRSPFVLALIGGVVGVGLLAGIFYYIIVREGESRRLKEATTAFDQSKYAEAEKLFLKFLEFYPETGSTDVARLGLHKSRVGKHIMTTTPDVTQGLKELEDLIRVGNDLDGFKEEQETVRRYADRLTFAGARVGEISQKPEPLAISKKAMEILRQFSPESGIPKDRAEELERRQRIAEAAIVKRMAFTDAVQQIRGQLEAGNTIGALAARKALIDRYSVLSEDKDVAALLQEILQREKELVTRSEIGIDASTQDPDLALRPLSLTLRTQVRNDLRSNGRAVYTVGIDSLFAVDADTGDPLWKRVIGQNPAFAPVTVSGTEEGLLVHSTIRNELMMLRQKDGSLMWRQPLTDLPSSEPLLHEQQIYLTTNKGELLLFSAANGRATARITFTQTVTGPPTLTRDGRSMLIPGDAMMIYTLSVNPLACSAVSYIDHRPGTIQSPMLTTGEVFLLADNDTAEKARLRILEMNPTTGQVSVRSTNEVDGQVRDPALLRGRELFIPSTPQRITAFRVTDDKDQTPLARIGANQLEAGDQTRMFLLAGPGGQVWLGGRDLRKFQTRTNAVVLDSGVTAEGIHLQPIQLADNDVFLTTRAPTLSSVYFTRADKEQMNGVWRTVLGANVVAFGPSVGDASILAVADFGQVFRVPLTQITGGGFSLEAISGFRLPDKLASSVGGLELLDGRLGAWCGAPEPAFWSITPTGQLERKWPLPSEPQAAPVAIAAGVVFPLTGRLHLTATKNGAPAEDYRAAQAAGQETGWKSLTALSDSQVLAVTSDNRLVRVEYRASPRPQLAEISVTQSMHTIDVAPTAANGMLLAATADGKLVLMQSSSLEVLAEAELGGVPARSPFVSGDHVFVDVGRRELRTYVIENGLTPSGVWPLEGQTLVGPPLKLADGSFLAARSDGLVMRLSAGGQPGDNSTRVGQALSRGPLLIGGQVIVVSVDGSLYALPAELTQ